MAIGTLGLLAEWVWTRIFFPMPQPFLASSLPLLIAAGTVAAVGGSLVALWHMSRLEVVAAPEPVAQAPGGRRGLPYRGYGLAGLAVFVVLMGIFAPQRAGDEKIGATVDYTDATFADGSTGEACDGERACSARVIVRFDDPLQVQDAIWLYAFGWQGRGPEGRKAEAEQGSDAGGVYRTALDPTGEPGEYRAELALPLHGSWKSMIRIHKAPSTLVAIPLHFPEDKAITSAAGREIMTEPGEHLIAQPEPKLLQRETKDDVPRWLWTTGYLLVLMAWIGVLLAYGWCYNRAAGARVAPRESASSQASVPSAPAGRP